MAIRIFIAAAILATMLPGGTEAQIDSLAILGPVGNPAGARVLFGPVGDPFGVNIGRDFDPVGLGPSADQHVAD